MAKKNPNDNEIEMTSSGSRRSGGNDPDRHNETDSLLPENNPQSTIIRTSSLPLEIFVYIHYHYSILFFLLNIALYAYKGRF